MEIKSGIYKHFKGGFVLVLFTAKHSDRKEIEVVYKGLNNGKFYARPIESFIEKVDFNGKIVSRFYQANNDEVESLLNQDSQSQELLKLFCK